VILELLPSFPRSLVAGPGVTPIGPDPLLVVFKSLQAQYFAFHPRPTRYLFFSLADHSSDPFPPGGLFSFFFFPHIAVAFSTSEIHVPWPFIKPSPQTLFLLSTSPPSPPRSVPPMPEVQIPVPFHCLRASLLPRFPFFHFHERWPLVLSLTVFSSRSSPCLLPIFFFALAFCIRNMTLHLFHCQFFPPPPNVIIFFCLGTKTLPFRKSPPSILVGGRDPPNYFFR